jgi:signal recognition particle receptor subunit beta
VVLVNYTTRELTAKLVYYGPGLCGKTTNLQYVYDALLPDDRRGKMVSLATETDRTLFFDFLPLEIGTIKGLKTRLQLYTVPGQVHYNATRKIVLKGADGIVFVADSQRSMKEANKESFKNMKDNLAEHGLDLKAIPHVLQFNKRDLPDVMPVEEMFEDLNEHNVPF